MQGHLSGEVAARTVRPAAIASLAFAAIGFTVFAILGHLLSGVALAVGFLLGAGNGLLAARLIGLPLPFMVSSLARLVTLSMIGVAIGFTLGLSNIWLVALGLGVSQFIIAASALRQVVGR